MNSFKIIKMIICMTLMMSSISFAQNANIRFGVPSQNPAAGVTFTVPVYISPPSSALGGYTFSISFDPSMLTIQSVQSGTAVQFDCSPSGCTKWNPDSFSSGYCIITGHQGESLSQPADESLVCSITFKATDIIVENSIIYYACNPITICSTAGQTYSAEPVFEDYFIGTREAKLDMISDAILGKRILSQTEFRAFDVNRDNAVTINDLIDEVNAK